MSGESLVWAALAFWGWLIPAALQASVLILIVAAVDWMLPRRTWPQLRAALWAAALLKLALPAWLWAPWGIGIQPPAAGWLALFLPSDPGTGLAGAPALDSSGRPVWWALAAPLVWLAGSFILAVYGAARWRGMRRGWEECAVPGPLPAELAACLEAARAAARLTRAPRLVVSPTVPAPLLAGLMRPAIYIPRDLPGAVGAEGLRLVLLHEMTHLKRLDPWRAAWFGTLQILYWFHPLVWMACRRLATLREQCCDRAVARMLAGDTAAYRSALLAVASRALTATPGRGLMFVVPRPSFALRLELLDRAAAEPAWLRRAVVAAALCLMVIGASPVARNADVSSRSVAVWIAKPPGCLQLRMMVLERLAQEESR